MSWLRRNRWGLALLPVAAALAVLASSSRVVLFWWPYGPHEVTSVPLGTRAHLEQPWQDRSGKYVRDVDVTVTAVEPTTVIRNWDNEDIAAHGPAGTRLWRVSLELAAPVDDVVDGCQLAILDTRGREFGYSAKSHVTPDQVKTSPCVNSDEEGPQAALIEGKGQVTEEGHERPPTWSTVADVVLAADAVPASVRIWWEYPKVIEVDVPRATAQ